jgi:aspartate kinase
MIVMKFGGTSLGDGERIRMVTDIVRSRLPRDPVLVVSAHAGVTDHLITAARAALKGEVSLRRVILIHQRILKDLSLPPDLVADELSGLMELLRGIALVGELTPRSLDLAMSFGERMSSKIVAAQLTKAGIPAKRHLSFEVGFDSDGNFQKAVIQRGSSRKIAGFFKKLDKDSLPVMTGFLARDREGNITTLGRSGSDLTATYLGAALGAEEVEIWTDVDGVMTADPGVEPRSRCIDSLSFEEASELAYYGAQVLHPSTIIPAIRKNVPVRVLNTYAPDKPGTVIVAESIASPEVAKSIVYKEDITLITVASTGMLMQPGFMARIFRVFEKYSISVDMIATSEVTVSLTVDSSRNLNAAIRELSQISDVTVDHQKTLLAVVGYGIRETRGFAAKVFAAVAETGVNVQMISQGATKINISFLIDNSDILPVVQALHSAFFGRGSARRGARKPKRAKKPSGKITSRGAS